MTVRRRGLMKRGLGTVVAAGVGMPLYLPAARAQAYPSKPITFIVPWPAGGSSDITLRAMCERASKVLGQPFQIDNKGGASGTLGPATMAATARPDGYTVSQLPISVFRLPVMQKTAFDPLKDFTYVSHLSGYTFGVTTAADQPYKTFKDVIEYAKANPGKVTYGTPGAGTSLHIGMERIAAAAGIKWTMVPFKGGAETNAAVLGKHTTLQADSTGWKPLVDAGQLRLLCVWTEKRTKNWPDVPTLKDLGFDMVFDSPFGMGGPKGMDPLAVKKLDEAFKVALEDKDVIATLEKYDMSPRYMPTAAYDKFARQLYAEEKAALEKLGLAAKS
ncbi:Bug family tripartite tricarboxylate transporter substrate binding protein [Reyranella sp.]|uniref:Bug family tripartite tricarboxylate transporter substrate binding protein n=1 Tax=Reyranella sp. TaxID=1929291 RepID=UPI003C7D767C